MGNNRNPRIQFICDFCGQISSDKPSHYKRKRRHFCSQSCYSAYRREIMLPEEQPTWRGGVSRTESHRRWKKKNPEHMAHLKARRYAREKGAKGSHTFKEWNEVKQAYNNRCAFCGLETKLTKDHIIPLSKGGTDYIENIQPLCRSCNSRKWTNVYENPEIARGGNEAVAALSSLDAARGLSRKA